VYDVDPTGASRAWAFTGANSLSGRTATDVTQVLTNDHPISVTYDDTADTGGAGGASGFVALATVQGGSLPLFGASNNQVECASCHNPHETGTVPFLRVSNAASALCTTCHSK
jgi:predicted CXXCH cytochrome family protein